MGNVTNYTTHTHTHTYTHIHTHTRTRTHARAHVHARTHTHTQVPTSDFQTDLVIHIYCSGSHKMKGSRGALFEVAMCHRLVTGPDTRNRGVMLITGAVMLVTWRFTLVTCSYLNLIAGPLSIYMFSSIALQASTDVA